MKIAPQSRLSPVQDPVLGYSPGSFQLLATSMYRTLIQPIQLVAVLASVYS